jgi:hypothetical protein
MARGQMKGDPWSSRMELGMRLATSPWKTTYVMEPNNACWMDNFGKGLRKISESNEWHLSTWNVLSLFTTAAIKAEGKWEGTDRDGWKI